MGAHFLSSTERLPQGAGEETEPNICTVIERRNVGNPLKHDVSVNNISILRSSLTENAIRLHYIKQSLSYV
jgi:hypothetical protein